MHKHLIKYFNSVLSRIRKTKSEQRLLPILEVLLSQKEQCEQDAFLMLTKIPSGELSACESHVLGAFYYLEVGVKQELKRAFELCSSAAEQGYADAQCDLATFFYSEGKLVDKDLAKTYDLYSAAAKQGLAQAQYFLGTMYALGTHVEKNMETAFNYFLAAAIKENASGQFETGLCYLHGTGVEKDINKGIEYLVASVNQGHRYAQYLLATYCYSGKFVVCNKKLAIALLCSAAKEGLYEAQEYLAQDNNQILKTAVRENDVATINCLLDFKSVCEAFNKDDIYEIAKLLQDLIFSKVIDTQTILRFLHIEQVQRRLDELASEGDGYGDSILEGALRIDEHVGYEADKGLKVFHALTQLKSIQDFITNHSKLLGAILYNLNMSFPTQSTLDIDCTIIFKILETYQQNKKQFPNDTIAPKKGCPRVSLTFFYDFKSSSETLKFFLREQASIVKEYVPEIFDEKFAYTEHARQVAAQRAAQKAKEEAEEKARLEKEDEEYSKQVRKWMSTRAP